MDTEPSSEYHSEMVKTINADMRAKNAAGLELIDLSAESLIATAMEQAGIDHFRDESFLPDFKILMTALENEAQLNPFGRLLAQTSNLESLKNRLWADACFEAHPEILERKIVAPIFIIGPHRSGTTRLHRMMATDKQLRPLWTWEGNNPAPRIGQPDMGREARYQEVKQAFLAMQDMYPVAFLGHPMDADWAEEDMLLLNHSFCSFPVLGNFCISNYYKEHFRTADRTNGYKYMADLMRLIAWSHDDPEDKRWIQKNPQHMLDLPQLLETFPDAKLIFTHRDPLKTVASIISLMWLFARQHTDQPCRGIMRDVWQDFAHLAARRCMDAREKIPASQQIDVYYEDVNKDWEGVMKRIYDFAGIDFSADTQQEMADWLHHSETENRHGGHRYALEDFGSSTKEIDDLMMFVREKYNLGYEISKK